MSAYTAPGGVPWRNARNMSDGTDAASTTAMCGVAYLKSVGTGSDQSRVVPGQQLNGLVGSPTSAKLPLSTRTSDWQSCAQPCVAMSSSVGASCCLPQSTGETSPPALNCVMALVASITF